MYCQIRLAECVKLNPSENWGANLKILRSFIVVRSEYMQRESIQIYLNPKYWTIFITSWKVFERSDNSILFFIDKKLSCRSFLGIYWPQQWLRVTYFVQEAISEVSQSRGEIVVLTPMSIKRVGREAFFFRAQSRCSVVHSFNHCFATVQLEADAVDDERCRSLISGSSSSDNQNPD
jgi:hypothetical protein